MERTSRIAQEVGGSTSLIFPFGKPHPEDDFQPFTKRHYTVAKEES